MPRRGGRDRHRVMRKRTSTGEFQGNHGPIPEIGMGPINFDLEMARKHGWTEAELENAWTEIKMVYLRYSRRVVRRNPKLYRKYRTGRHLTTVYTGP